MTLIARDATYNGDPTRHQAARTVYRYDDGTLEAYPMPCDTCGHPIAGYYDRCEHAEDDQLHADPSCCPGCAADLADLEDTLRRLPR